MSSVHIQTAIKVRPFIEREKRDKLEPSWLVKDNSIVQIDSAKNFIGDPYSFDHIFDDTQSNKDVYDSVVKPLVMSCFEGINSTIFAYGQTSSGKTHTMLGSKKFPGIISFAVQDIFDYINKSSSTKFLLRCSYLEIYNEKINDLLDTNATDIKIREGFEGVYVVVKEEVVREPEDLFNLMNKGMKTRKIGCTDMNERSSRSHTIFKLIIQSQALHSEGSYVESTLNLVDLAGSERVGQMNMEKERQVEGVSINKSLTTLGLVIRKLSENDAYINYRDSKLTRLLQHSLGGNSKTLIIANITIAALEETKSTLEFAQRAKYVKNQPIRNEKVTDKDQLKQYEHLCEEYKDQIEKLRLEKLEKEKTINALEGKISNIELFSTKTLERKIKPPSRRHTFAFKPPDKKLFSIREPGESHEFQEDISKQVSPAKSELFFPVTHNAEDKENGFLEECCFNAEDKENIFLEEVCFSPPYKLARPSLPKSPGTPYSTLKQEKQLIEESLECLKSFTNHEHQYGNELDDLKELVNKLRLENIELRAELKDKDSEVNIKAAEDTQDVYEKLLLLKSILEVKPLQDTRRNSLNTIIEEEIDLFDDDIDSSITSSPIKVDNNATSSNKMCSAIIEENKDLKWQLNEKERIIRGLRNDFNSEKLNIDAAFTQLNQLNANLLKELDDIKCENEKLKIKLAQDKDIKECELDILNSKIKKLTDYKEELHRKLSELQQKSEVSSADLTKINEEEWQSLKKDHEELKSTNENNVFKIKELEEEICLLKIEIIQKGLEVDELKKSKECIFLENKSLTEELGQLKSELDDVMFSLSGEQKELEKVSQELEERCQNAIIMEKQMEMYLNDYKKLSEELLEKDELLQHTIEQNKKIELKLRSNKEQFEESSLELQEKKKELEQKSQQIASLEKLVFEQEQLEVQNQERLIKLNELFKDICKKDETIETLQKTISGQKIQNEVDLSETQEAILSLTKLVSEKKQLEAQNQELLIKLTELSEDILKKDEIIQKLQRTVSELNAQNQEHSIKLDELNRAICEKDETIETLQKTVSEMNAQNQADYNERKETIISLQRTIEDMKQNKEIENYQMEIKTVKEQLETTSLKLQEKSKQLEEKSEDIAVLEKKLFEMEAQNETVMLKMKETIQALQMKIEDMKQHEEQEKKLFELNSQNKTELMGKEETIRNLQKTIEDMKQNKENENYQMEIKTAKEQLETTTLELQEKTKQLEEKSEDIAVLEKKLFEMEAQNETVILKMKETIEALQMKIEDMKQYEEEEKKLFELNSQNKTELLGKEETIRNLQKTIEDMRQNKEIENYQMEIKTAKKQLETTTLELQEKTKQLEEKSEDIAVLEKKLSEMEAQNETAILEMEETIEALQMKIEDMKLQYEEQEKKSFKLNSQNKTELLGKEETIKILQKTIEDMKQNDEIEKLQHELVTATEKSETLSLELNEKHMQLKEQSENVAELEKKLSELESQNKIQIIEKKETIKALQNKIEDMKQNEEIEEYQEKLAAATKNLEALSSKLQETCEQLKEKCEDLAELENKLSELESQNKLELLEKEETIRTLQKKIEDNMEQNQELKVYQQELAKAMEKLQKLSSKLLENSEELKEKSEHVAKLEKDLSKLESQNKIQLVEKEKTIKTMQEEIEDMEQTIETLQRKLEDTYKKQEPESCKLELKTMKDEFERLSKELKGKSEKVEEISQLLEQLKAQNFKKINQLLTDLSKKEETIKSLHKELENRKQNMNTKEMKLLNSKLLDLENRLKEKDKLFELVSLESEKWEDLHRENLNNIEELSKNLLEKSKTVEKLQKKLETSKEKYHLELTTIKNQLKHYEETELSNSKLKNTMSIFIEKEKSEQIELNTAKLEELEALKKKYTDKLTQFEKVTNENVALKKQLSKMKENLVNKSFEIEKLTEQINKMSPNETTINSYQIFGNDSYSQLDEIKHIKKDLNEKLYENRKLHEEKKKLQEMVQELNKSGLEKKRRLEELKGKYNSLELEMAKTNRDLFLKEQDLVKEKSAIRRLEQQLSALQKKKKHEPETPTEKPSRQSIDGRVTPNELRKIKRHSLLEQRRGISSEFSLLDNDSSDSECSKCASLKKKFDEMSIEIEKLKEEVKYLDKENVKMLEEGDWLKGDRLRLIFALDEMEALAESRKKLLDAAATQNKVDQGTQATCDYHKKYLIIKKVASQRREEGNYLRKKLNLPEDCPVLPKDLDGQSPIATM